MSAWLCLGKRSKLFSEYVRNLASVKLLRHSCEKSAPSCCDPHVIQQRHPSTSGWGRPRHPRAGRPRFPGDAYPGLATLKRSSGFPGGAGLRVETDCCGDSLVPGARAARCLLCSCEPPIKTQQTITPQTGRRGRNADTTRRRSQGHGTM